MQTIPLRNKFKEAIAYAIVDDEDFERINQYRWYFNGDKYPVTTIRNKELRTKKTTFMHRMVIEPEYGKEIDHINCDKLNNTRDNLRECYHFENVRNGIRRNKEKTSKYRGVYYIKKKKRWFSQVMIHGKYVFRESFKTEKEAALAYNIVARIVFGEFAYINEVK